MRICDYGCGNEGKYIMSSAKCCCQPHYNKCPEIKNKNSEAVKRSWSKERKRKNSNRMKELWKDPDSIFNSEEWKEKNSNGVKQVWKDPNSKYNSKEHRKLRKYLNTGKGNPMYGKKHPKRRSIEKIEKKYFLFSKIEEMRYNPEKLDEKEIQVHCKNHKCENSKEKSGWFTPTGIQMSERLRSLEGHGVDNAYFYCSDECKNVCPLYNLKSDPFLNAEKPYTPSEYQTCREEVFKRANGLCEYCGEIAEHMHHIMPQKLYTVFVLDPDYCIAACEKCHYEKGHETGTECSTGNLSNKICLG